MVAFEGAPSTTYRELLLQDGFICPSPENLDEQGLNEALEDLIQALTRRRIYLHSTDHLSDRELYDYFHSSKLDEPAYDFPAEAEITTHIDLIGSGDKDDTFLWLKYYASEEDRREWAKEWPDEEMPAKEDLPYDRDRSLPGPDDSS